MFVIDVADYDTAMNMDERCSCLIECETSSYSSTVSSARLSDTSVLAGKTAAGGSTLVRGFRNALEIAARVDANDMLKTLRLVENVINAQQELRNMIQFYFASDTTSLSTSLLLLSTGLFRMLQNTVNSNRALHAEMDTVDMTYVYYIIKDMTSFLETAELSLSRVTKNTIEDLYSARGVNSLLRHLDNVIDALANFDGDLDEAYSHMYVYHLFPKRLLLSQSCLAAKNGLNSSSFELKTWLSDRIHNPNSFYFFASDHLPRIAEAFTQMSRASS